MIGMQRLHWMMLTLLGACNMLRLALPQRCSGTRGEKCSSEEWLQGLKDYETVIPRRTKSLNSEQYSRHFFRKRSSPYSHFKKSNVLSYSFTAFRKTFHLKLTPNTEFISPNLIIEKRSKEKNETWINSDPASIQHCFHIGTVHDDPHSIVSVSLCDYMMGSIFAGTAHYLIQPHPVLYSANKELQEVPHIIYKADYPISNNFTGYCGVKSGMIRERNRPAANISKMKRKKRAATLYQGNDEHYVELMIVADEKMVEFHGSDLEHYLFVLMSIVSSIYKKHTIQNNINIVVVKVMLLEYKDAGPHISTNAATTLHNFCQWQHSQNTNDDSINTHHDTAVLVTRTDICRSREKCDTLGLAELGTICDPLRSCAIAEDNGLSAAFTIAHELGHVFSLPHDDDYRCWRYTQGRNSGYSLMAPTLDYTSNPWSWSVCSAAELTEFLDAGHGKCLQDKPRRLQYLEQIQSNSAIEPGEQYSVDQQCSQAFGTASKLCPYSSGDESKCKRLWCTSPSPYGHDSGCRTQHMPWADGTKCGPNMWCVEGQCRQRHSISPVHGSWSEWQAYGECSRTCGGGIMKSQRQCNSPAPRHGGRYCVGERVRYISCKTNRCPVVDMFREEQCAKHNGNNFKITSVGKDVKWKPKYSGVRSEDRCKLFCQSEGNSAIYYRLEAKVKDGTKCDPFTSDVCVNGKCKPAGCDNLLGSSKKQDHCGVCDGDGTSCRKVKKKYNPQARKYGYNVVTLIRKGSSNIHIEQHGHHNRKNDDNYLALRNQANQYILNGKYIVSMAKKEIHVKGAVMEYSGSNNVVEIISGNRPIQEDIYLEVLSVGKLYPPNITYEYTTPTKPTSNEPTTSTEFYPDHHRREESRYKWIKRFQHCITECGDGRKKKIFCAQMPNKHHVADQYCEKNDKAKPKESECQLSHTKSMGQCESVWRRVFQSSCSAQCGQGEGYVKRKYKCFRVYSKTYQKTEIVSDKYCLVKHKKPKDKVPCRGICLEPHWQFSDWSKITPGWNLILRTDKVMTRLKCTATCDGGLQHRHSKCVDNNDEVIPDALCSKEIRKVSQVCNRHQCPYWVHDEWGQCSVTCGNGTKHRKVWCQQEDKPTSKELCSSKSEPKSGMDCNVGQCLKPSWKIGSWEDCSVTCGTGIKSRLVTCTFEEQILENTHCKDRIKLSTEEACYMSKCPVTTTIQTSLSTKQTVSNSLPTSIKSTTSDSDRPKSSPSHSLTSDAPETEVEPLTETQWRTGSWTECSVTCGRGIRGRYVSCRDRHGNMVLDSSCLSIPKPASQENCIAKPCGQWQIGEWSPCPVTCGKGKKMRHVKCVIPEGLEEQLKSPVFCDMNVMPSKDLECNTQECLSPIDMEITSIETNRVEATSHWRAGPWGRCSVTCGGGWRRRAVVCMDESGISSDCNPANHPKDKERCKSDPCPIWRNGKWNQCSTNCGGGIQFRMVVCQVPKGSIIDNNHCDITKKPQISRRCKTNDCSKETFNGSYPKTYWYKGPWTKCSVSCGKGGVKTRTVICMDSSGQAIHDRSCRRQRKPKTKRKCRGASCPRWGIGRWGRCSVECGNGKQNRKVICLAGRRRTADPKKCSHIPKPNNSRSCKGRKCGRFVWQAGKWSTCSKSCGSGLRYRGVRCIDRSRRNDRVNDYYCAFNIKPKRRSRCMRKRCQRNWNQKKRLKRKRKLSKNKLNGNFSRKHKIYKRNQRRIQRKI